MHPDFWHDRWQANKIEFHEKNGNPLLVKHLDVLALAPGARVFLPLCGKTLDIGRLLAQGFRVVGVELVESAIVQLFDELGITPQISRYGALTCYRADDLDVFVGDFFALSQKTMGPVDAVFDRAAYVALPADMRPRYAAHVTAITGAARQMLLTFEYDQSQMPGPPFSVEGDEVAARYGDRFEVTLIDRVEIRGGLKGLVPATAAVWLLMPR